MEWNRHLNSIAEKHNVKSIIVMTNSLSEKSSMEIGARVKAKGLEKDKLKKNI